MTEAELEILRLKVRMEVHQTLLRGLYTFLANTLPGGSQAFRDRFQALRQEHSKIVLPETSPGYSDLVAAEYQAALEDALTHIEGGFHG